MSTLGIKIKSLRFNHKSNPLEGGIHICEKYDKAVVLPEWKEPAAQSPFALVAEKLLNLKIVAELEYKLENVEKDQNVKARISVKMDNPVRRENVGTSVEISITQKESGPEPSGGLLEFSIPLDLKTMQGFLRKYVLSLAWSCTSGDVNMVQIDTSTEHPMYIFQKMPRLWRVEEGSDYNASYKDYPSTLVMDYFMALTDYGTKYPPYNSDATAKVTCAVNNSIDLPLVTKLLRYRYDEKRGASFYSGWDNIGKTYTFNMKMWQDDIKDALTSGQTRIVNCIDCAFIVQHLSSLAGEEISIGILNGNGTGFLYNPINPIGHGFTAPGGFSFHAVAFKGHTADYTSRIYDACLKMDPNANIQRADLLPVNMAYAPDAGCLSVPDSGSYYLNRLVGAQQLSPLYKGLTKPVFNMICHADKEKAGVQRLLDNVFSYDNMDKVSNEGEAKGFDDCGIHFEAITGLDREGCEERLVSILMETSIPYTLLSMERIEQLAYSALQFGDWMLIYFDQDVFLRLTTDEACPRLLEAARRVVKDKLWESA